MKRNSGLVVLVLLIFFVISFLTNIIGPLVPDILTSFDLSLTLVALLPFAFFIAYGVFSIPAGMLIERLGQKPVLVSAFGIAFVGSLMLAVYPDYITAVCSLFLIGSGMAMLQVGINPLLREAGGEEHFAFNSVMAQLVFGLASFISPLVYSSMVLELQSPESDREWLSGQLSGIVPPDLPWVSLYWLFAATTVVMVAVLAMVRFPKIEVRADERSGTLGIYVGLLKNRLVLAYFVGIFAYVGSEQGVANWISQFLLTYHGYDPHTTGASTVSWFWGMMTAGCLLGLALLKLIDSRKVLIGFTVLAIASLTAAILGPGWLSLYAFPAVGFFASVMWSIIFSLALNSVKEHHGSFSGILVTGIIGGAIVPLVVGSLGEQFGLRTGLSFIYLTLGYILSVGFWSRPLIVNKTVEWKS